MEKLYKERKDKLKMSLYSTTSLQHSDTTPLLVYQILVPEILYPYDKDDFQQSEPAHGNLLDCPSYCCTRFGATSDSWYEIKTSSTRFLRRKILTMIQDISAFSDLRRSAQLSSAAYSGCSGTAFDITVTKTIRDTLTDTDVRPIYTRVVLSKAIGILIYIGLYWIFRQQENNCCCDERIHYQ